MQVSSRASESARRIEELASRPHRNRSLHWVAFAASLFALYLIIATLALDDRQAPARIWLWLDIGFGIAFAFEFFTRSGFNRGRIRYTLTHFFDFVAIVPALALVSFGVPFVAIYVWIILVARAVRIVDRILGDGFVERMVIVVVEGIEEEITSRVFLRILDRIQAALNRSRLTYAVAEALARNKGSVLERVKAAHPQDGIGAGLAHITGLDAALERAEERTYDAIVEMIKSPEVDRACQDVIASMLSNMKEGIAVKAWRQHFGIEQEQLSSPRQKP